MEKYGPVFSVHSVSRKHYTNIKQWEYKINKKVRTHTERRLLAPVFARLLEWNALIMRCCFLSFCFLCGARTDRVADGAHGRR